MIGIHPSTQVVNGSITQEQYENKLAEWLYKEIIIDRRIEIAQIVPLLEVGAVLHMSKAFDRFS